MNTEKITKISNVLLFVMYILNLIIYILILGECRKLFNDQFLNNFVLNIIYHTSFIMVIFFSFVLFMRIYSSTTNLFRAIVNKRVGRWGLKYFFERVFSFEDETKYFVYIPIFIIVFLNSFSILQFINYKNQTGISKIFKYCIALLLINITIGLFKLFYVDKIYLQLSSTLITPIYNNVRDYSVLGINKLLDWYGVE